MQEQPTDNTVNFPTTETPDVVIKNPLPDYKNGKVFQILNAARDRFFPALTNEELGHAESHIKDHPELDYVAASKSVTELLDLDKRREAWVKKESKIEPMIEEMAELIKKYGLFPVASPHAVAAYVFHQIQGAGLILQDLLTDAEEHGGDDVGEKS